MAPGFRKTRAVNPPRIPLLLLLGCFAFQIQLLNPGADGNHAALAPWRGFGTECAFARGFPIVREGQKVEGMRFSEARNIRRRMPS